jgi:glucoamylase
LAAVHAPDSSLTRARRGSPRRILATASACVALAGSVTACAAFGTDPGLSLLVTAGVAQDPCHPGIAVPVPPHLRGQFTPDSSVLVTAHGYFAAPGRVVPASAAESACAAATVLADRAWLNAGVIPGTTAAQRQLSSRALLDLRLAVQPDGAVVAGWHPGWEYSWPRDSSWVAAALAGTGHPASAYRILRFLQKMQPSDGIWAARYQLGGRGPVQDGRPPELDSSGWVPWAAWSWFTAADRADPAQAAAGLRQLWPMIARAADAAAASLTSDGLPRPAMDYWESSARQSTIETAAALRTGLLSAADLAGPAGDPRGRVSWSAAAARLSRAITASFGRTGYQRTPAGGSGDDAAVTLLAPPFGPASPVVTRAVNRTAAALRIANGGMLPGKAWPGNPTIAWTPETAFFALYGYFNGQTAAASQTIAWLAAHRTALGTLPEQVNRDDQPVSVAPLSWTNAIVLLALLAQGHQLPAVPAPR